LLSAGGGWSHIPDMQSLHLNPLPADLPDVQKSLDKEWNTRTVPPRIQSVPSSQKALIGILPAELP